MTGEVRGYDGMNSLLKDGWMFPREGGKYGDVPL